ncbi:MAG: ribosomal protein S18-alanine N-acetyltransferase [Oscillospiraceae bacterium]|nr:ribosomal protein S18-alanine N-acetyltransferase [Oscillospiraceae bacterium]
MKGMLIRPMDTDSVAGVAALEQICFTRPWSLSSLEEELRNPLAVYFTALREGEVVGYAGMHRIFGEGHITNLGVSPTHRRQGVAIALLKTLLAHANERELALLTLEVRTSNAAAIALYGGLGFAPVGLRKGYYDAPKEDALIMTLKFGDTQ